MKLPIEYQKETGEEFFPFARRQDCDTVAGFAITNGKIEHAVISVHLTWSGQREKETFPRKVFYENMFEWLINEVIPDTQAWMSEEEIENL